MPRKGGQTLRDRRRRDILDCAPDLVIAHHGWDTFGQIAQHLGLGTAALRRHVNNEAELIRLLCRTHIEDMFNAVCQNTGRVAGSSKTLHAMAGAVLATAAAHPARHRIYLLHRFMLATPQRRILEICRASIENSFHFALHDLAPHNAFAALREPARILVGQLLHAPLWWPNGSPAVQTGWLVGQIGCIADLADQACENSRLDAATRSIFAPP